MNGHLVPAGRLAIVLTPDSAVSHDELHLVSVHAGRLEGRARSFGPGGHRGVVVRRPA